jgi:endonuclease YncB( thermonuclease family)
LDGPDHLGEPVKRAIAGAFLALCVVLGLLWWTSAHPPGVTSAPDPPAASAEEVAPAARDVTPPNMIPGPKVEGPLTRLTVPEPQSPPPRWRRFFLPVVEEAGLIRLGKRTVRVEGIAQLTADATCAGGIDGESWNCGREALTALQRLIRARAIECLVSANDNSATLIAPCRLGTFDLALWLATTGWGKPSPGASATVEKAAAAARCARRGLWRDVEPTDCTDPNSTGATLPPR